MRPSEARLKDYLMYRLKTGKLLLVGDNKSKELNPEIADVDGVSVDARIAKNVKEQQLLKKF